MSNVRRFVNQSFSYFKASRFNAHACIRFVDTATEIAKYTIREEGSYAFEFVHEQSPLVAQRLCYEEGWSISSLWPPIFPTPNQRRWNDYKPYGSTTNAVKNLVTALKELYNGGNEDGTLIL